MADVTSASTVRQGVIVMDPRLTADSVWTAESTGLTQAGPVPGVPVPQRRTRAVLQAHGEQATGAGLRVLAQGTGMLWREDGDAATLHRGWNPPCVLTGWEAVRYLDGSVNQAVSANYPHAATMADGTVVVVQQSYQTSPATQDVIQCSVRDPNTGAWAGVVAIEAQGAVYSTGREGHPSVCVLPDGRLICCYMVEPSSDTVQVRTAYSDDSGATWTIASQAALAVSIPYQASGTPRTVGTVSEFTRLRIAYKDGQILMVICARESDTDPDGATASAVQCRDVLRQYASYDLGLSFQEIAVGATNLPGYTGRYADLCVSGGYFWLAFVVCYDTDGNVDAHTRVIKLGSAGQRFDRSESTFVWTGATGTITTFSGATNFVRRLTDGDCAIVAADDGIIYVLDRGTTSGACFITQSDNQGRDWQTMGLPNSNTVGTGIYATWWFATTSDYPTDFAATWQRGRALVLHGWVASVGNEDNSIGCAYLGGYTTATNPHAYGMGLAAPVLGVDSTWLPIERPSDAQYTGVGAGSDALTGGALNVSTTANERYFTLDFSAYGTMAAGFIVRGSMAIVSGGALTTNAHAVRIRLADGVSDYDGVLRFATTGVRLYDNNAAATVDDTVITLTDGCDFLIFVGGGGKWRSWVRVRTLSEDGKWRDGPTGTLTNDGATPAATHLLEWGCIATSTSEANWYELHLTGNAAPSYSMTVTADRAASTTNPDDLYPRRWWPDPVYVNGGTSISQRGGPPFSGDSWLISARYLYGVERIFPSTVASPLVGWRSVADSSEMYIALDLDAGLTAEHYPECDTIGLCILGANWRTGELQGYTGGAWVTIGTVDAAGGPTGARFQSLGAVRLGNTLRPNTSASDKPWVSRDELAGWTVDMDGSTKRRIIANSAGLWDSATAGERPTIIMEGVEPGDPASPSIRMYPPDFVHVFNLLGATYAGYRLKISSQSTVDGYYKIGSMLLGPVLVHGYEPAWGSSSEIEDLTEAEERLDGSIQSRSLGKPRRIYEWGWDEIDETRQASGDYHAGSSSVGALPTATLQDTVASMVGTYRRLLGRHSLCCVVRSIPVGSTGADTKTINRWSHFVFGRITSPLRVANVLGRHGSNEVVRLSSVTMTEER